MMSPGYNWRLFIHCIGLVYLQLCAFAASEDKSKCDTCVDMVKKFHEGIKNTSKSNFGGGNTHWEEQSLGSWAFSETRFVEIAEHLCDSSNQLCHGMYEEHEEVLENWWFKEYAKDTNVDLHQYFCISQLKVCCPKGTFGKTCQECTGGKTKPCNGNGDCDGDGKREGTGECRCSAGYTGEICDQCKEGYYEVEENGEMTCTACHEACDGGCAEGGPKGCHDCKTGWQESEDEGCVDVDECLGEDDTPCSDSEYCSNSEGSHVCLACHPFCSGCSGSGPTKCFQCKENHFLDDGTCKSCHKSCEGSCTGATAGDCEQCKEGWERSEDGQCVDINECSSDPCEDNQYCINNDGSHMCSRCSAACNGCYGEGFSQCTACSKGYNMVDSRCEDVDECEDKGICARTHEVCENKPGRYSCVCEKGYVKKGGECVVKKESKKKKVPTATLR